MLDFRIPKDSGVLKAMAVYLQEQALAVSPEPLCAHCACHAVAVAPVPDAVMELTPVERSVLEAAQVERSEAAAATDAAAAFGQSLPSTAAMEESAKRYIEGTTDASAPPPPEGVELAAGIPWDERIHGGSKTKYATAPFGWKLKRGVNKDLVPVVEAELWAAMAVPATVADSIPPEATQSFKDAAAETVAPPPPAETTETKVEVPGSTGEGTTFPQFMGMVTASKFSTETVAAAVQKVGLASTVLLATRPDLIPAVVSELYPGA